MVAPRAGGRRPPGPHPCPIPTAARTPPTPQAAPPGRPRARRGAPRRPPTRRPSTSATAASCCARCSSCTARWPSASPSRAPASRAGSPARRSRRASPSRRCCCGWSRCAGSRACWRACRRPPRRRWRSGSARPAPPAAGRCRRGWGLGLVVDAPAFAAGRWPAPALAGASLAALLVGWLRLRATAQAPADTSARLAELQARIRPHFLFNTLNTAIALARVDPARTEELLEDLAELFRVALAGGDAAATLADELDLARRYLAIEQARFGERLRVTWEIDPAADAARLPALLLQPLVENAVRHGVEPDPAGGTLRIATRARGAQAVVTIVNTLPPGDAAAAPRPGAGMALANVRERLRLMHDVAAGFEAAAAGAEYRVRIVVPLA